MGWYGLLRALLGKGIAFGHQLVVNAVPWRSLWHDDHMGLYVV